MSVVLNTSFPGPDANPIGGIWSTLTSFSYAAVQQVSNQATGTISAGYCGVYDNTNTYTNDQYCAVTMGAFGSFLGSGDLAGPLVRIDPVAGSGVRWQLQNASTGSRLDYALAGTFNPIATGIILSVAATAGDIYELDAVGQVYSLYHTPISTGVRYLVASITDAGAHVTAGTIGFTLDETRLADNTAFSNVTAGDLVLTQVLPTSGTVADLPYHYDHASILQWQMAHERRHITYVKEMARRGNAVTTTVLSGKIDDDWFGRHATAHQALARVIGANSLTSTVNLSAGWKNEPQFYDWMQRHTLLHRYTDEQLELVN